MWKRFWSALACVLLLSACGGSGGESGSSVECAFEYWNGAFGTCLPEGWSVLERETLLLRGVTDEYAVAFQADAAVSGQFPIVTLSQEPLAADVSPLEYSEASVRSVVTFTGYTLIDLADYSFDTDAVQLHVFRAKPQQKEQERRFYQISTAAGERGYTLTGMAPVTLPDSVEEEILKIFGCATWQADAELRAERFGAC